jgi:hypothetical protein
MRVSCMKNTRLGLFLFNYLIFPKFLKAFQLNLVSHDKINVKKVFNATSL